MAGAAQPSPPLAPQVKSPESIALPAGLGSYITSFRREDLKPPTSEKNGLAGYHFLYTELMSSTKLAAALNLDSDAGSVPLRPACIVGYSLRSLSQSSATTKPKQQKVLVYEGPPHGELVRGLTYHAETEEQGKAIVEVMAEAFGFGECVEVRNDEIHFLDEKEPGSVSGLVVVYKATAGAELMKPSYYQKGQWRKELAVCMREASVDERSASVW